MAAEDELVQQLVNERSGTVLIVYTVHNGTAKYFEILATFVGIDDRFFYLELKPPAVKPQPQPQRHVQTIAAPVVSPRQVQLAPPRGWPGAGRVNKRKVELPSRGAYQCLFAKLSKKLKSKRNEKPRSKMLVTASR